MRLQSPLPAGVSALLFDSAERLRRLESRLVAELERDGFREAILPIVDYFAPYEPLLPPAARAELYRFADRAGEMLALRADFTPMLARLLAPHLAALELPLEIFYRGEVVRCPDRSAGNGRDGAETGPYQLGGELVDTLERGEALERQAALVLARLFWIATAGRGRLVFGVAGALDEILVAAAGDTGPSGAVELARAVSRRERRVARAAGGRAGAALLEIVETGKPTSTISREALGESGAAALAALERLCDEIEVAVPGLGVAVDLAEFADFAALGAGTGARDLRSYYGGLVLRGYLPGVAGPVASGGRYDELFRRLSGDGPAKLAAVGFSLRLDTLALAPVSGGPATPALPEGSR